jgi:hypothetical protein
MHNLIGRKYKIRREEVDERRSPETRSKLGLNQEGE